MNAHRKRPLTLPLLASLACFGLYIAYLNCHISAWGRYQTQLLTLDQLLQPSCGPAHQPFPADFWFVKTHKAGSSTLAGVLRTICARYGVVPVQRELVTQAQLNPFNGGDQDTTNMQKLRQAIHGTYNLTDAPAVAVVNHLKYSDAKAALFKQPLLKFTTVRHPLPRIYSQFFDDMCWRLRGGTGSLTICQEFGSDPVLAQKVLAQDTIEHRWKYIKSYPHNHVYNYIRGSAQSVEAAVKQYDFIFVSERMDEALVVFMLTYGLNLQDVAHLSVKNNTGRYKRATDMPQEMNAFIMAGNQLDLQLWQLANQQLDERIVQLQQLCGEQHFAGLLQTFRQMQAAVRQECSDYKGWYKRHGFGEPYSYVSDNGIGFRCVGHVARAFLAAQLRQQ